MSRTKHRESADSIIQRMLADVDRSISLLLELKHERQQRELAEAQLDEVKRIKAQIASICQSFKADNMQARSSRS